MMQQSNIPLLPVGQGNGNIAGACYSAVACVAAATDALHAVLQALTMMRRMGKALRNGEREGYARARAEFHEAFVRLETPSADFPWLPRGELAERVAMAFYAGGQEELGEYIDSACRLVHEKAGAVLGVFPDPAALEIPFGLRTKLFRALIRLNLGEKALHAFHELYDTGAVLNGSTDALETESLEDQWVRAAFRLNRTLSEKGALAHTPLYALLPLVTELMQAADAREAAQLDAAWQATLPTLLAEEIPAYTSLAAREFERIFAAAGTKSI